MNKIILEARKINKGFCGKCEDNLNNENYSICYSCWNFNQEITERFIELQQY